MQEARTTTVVYAEASYARDVDGEIRPAIPTGVAWRTTFVCHPGGRYEAIRLERQDAPNGEWQAQDLAPITVAGGA